MSRQTQQARSTLALAAAAADLATAERAARNISLHGHQLDPARNPVNLNDLITALLSVHDISGRMSKTVEHYAQAMRWPHSGYTAAFGEHLDYPRPVTDAATQAEHQLSALAAKLRLPAIGFSTDAIASLDVALADWRARRATAHS